MGSDVMGSDVMGSDVMGSDVMGNESACTGTSSLVPRIWLY